jgi:hypothetical protein
MSETTICCGREVSGYTLQSLLDAAIAANLEELDVCEFDGYQRRAIDRLIRRGAMPDDERADGRYFECRACGFNPYATFRQGRRQGTIKDWFFPLSKESRRDLVKLSRKIRVSRFASAGLGN